MKKIVNCSALILVAILLLTMIFWGKNYINISSKTMIVIPSIIHGMNSFLLK